MALKPLGDRIVIRPLDPEETTKSGLVVPDTAKEKPQEGKVVAVGTGRLLDDGVVKALEVRNGDRVLYGKYAGTEISLEGEDYLILREEDVLAVVH
ncbi:MAG: co-chaperone GroES [Candidatus Omnitrophota bacterium]|nr:co-chaperone GroES [Candidatus Omnitrophota bacterium]